MGAALTRQTLPAHFNRAQDMITPLGSPTAAALFRGHLSTVHREVGAEVYLGLLGNVCGRLTSAGRVTINCLFVVPLKLK